MTLKEVPRELLSDALRKAIDTAPVAVVLLNKCRRCSHVWPPRTGQSIGETDECPSCHSPYWATFRKNEQLAVVQA